MRKLEVASRRITKLIDAISATSMQTTMLAVSGRRRSCPRWRQRPRLRGCVERYPDPAREANENVDRIRETVDAVMEQIASVRRDLEGILDLAEVERGRSIATLEPMQQMGEDIIFLIDASKSIQAGAEAILEAAKQALEGSRQVAAAAEETSTATQQAAQASSDQAKGAEDLAAAIEEIASLAEELKA